MNLNWQNLKRSENVKAFIERHELDGLLQLGGGEAKFEIRRETNENHRNRW